MRKNKIMLILAAAMVAVVLIPSCATGGAGKDNLAVLARSAQVTRGGQREIKELNDGLVPDSVPEQMKRWMSNPNRQQQRQSGLNVMRYE